MISKSSEQENIKALNAFLEDIAILKPLEAAASQVNFFDILKITRMEIRHSNMLAWLLDPNENHGLGDRVLKGFLSLAARQKQLHDSAYDPSFAAQTDFYSFTIFREWCYIDILAVSQREKCVLCIENKIDADEHGDQLKLYANRIDQTYRDYRKLFVYLTPDKRESSDTDRWLSMSYEDVLNVIQDALSVTEISNEAKLIIENYMTTVRRDIMGNDETAKLVLEIYQKHKKAIDLIIEHLPDTVLIVRDIVVRWAEQKAREGAIIFDSHVPNINNTRYIRFRTETMSRILPDADDAYSAWGTHSYYYYEIVNVTGSDLLMQLTINSRDIPDDIRSISDRIEKLHRSPKQIKNWNYRHPIWTDSYELPDDLSEPVIHGLLDDMLGKLLTFEKELEKKLKQ
ncbi:MAG: PD-(D/E)XK nuclease family protein [Ruminococcus sp.]|nr:PD-(D/E)XK nuclease family protein [Ruminococcus sp.]